ncbi:MAG: MFS transporter [Lactobacillales bacterium]|jgi:MFS family permease|nr:MFS transporter [Lactobacillales bacterium]
MHKNIKKNLIIFNLTRFFYGFLPLKVFLVLYFQELTGSLKLAMGIFSIQYLTIMFLEIPMSVLSDKWSRKMVLILSSLCYILTYVFWIGAYYSYSYTLLVVGAILWGIGFALYSGSYDATLYETCQEGRKKFYKIFAKSSGYFHLSAGISAVLGGIIAYRWGYIYCAYGNLIALTCFCILFLFLIEPKRTKSNTHHFIKETKEIFEHVRRTKPLRILAIPYFLNMGIADSIERFESSLYIGYFSNWVLGILRLVREWSAMVGFWFSKKIIKNFGYAKTLLTSEALIIIFQFLALLINTILTPFIFVMTRFFIGTGYPVEKQLQQDHFLDEKRATMDSLLSIGASASIALFSFILGWIAEATTPLIAMLFVISLRPISLFFFAYLFKILALPQEQHKK